MGTQKNPSPVRPGIWRSGNFCSWSAAVLATALVMISGPCVMFGSGGRDDVNHPESPSGPAVEDNSRFSGIQNDNTNVGPRVKRLAHPEKLMLAASGHSVQTQSNRNAAAQNMGQPGVNKNHLDALQIETSAQSLEPISAAGPL